MTADRDIGADLEVGPAQLVLDLLVALLDPVPDAVQAHDFGQVCGRVRAVRLTRAARPGQVGDQVPGGLVRQGPRVGGGHHEAPGTVRTPPAQPRVGGPPGFGVPSRKVRVTGVQSPGSSGPSQARARAAFTGVCASAP